VCNKDTPFAALQALVGLLIDSLAAFADVESALDSVCTSEGADKSLGYGHLVSLPGAYNGDAVVPGLQVHKGKNAHGEPVEVVNPVEGALVMPTRAIGLETASDV